MIGVFVQINSRSTRSSVTPVGYVIAESGCWDWVGGKDKRGYGRVWCVDTQRLCLAHRYLWETHRSAIPVGMTLDHLCRNHGCVNPDHLEVVTNQRNVQRGMRGILKTHCPKGHLLSGDNLIQSRLREGYRACRPCNNARVATNRAKRKQGAA